MTTLPVLMVLLLMFALCMGAYIIYALRLVGHRAEKTIQRMTRLEEKLNEYLLSIEPKLQTMVDTAILVKAMAKSFSTDSKRTLENVQEEIQKGVEVATRTAATLAAGISPVPPSDPKIIKPQLPSPHT